MNSYVADTMAIILYLEKRKMPEKVKNIFVEAEQEKCKILIPSMVLAEIGYLSEKERIDIKLVEVVEKLKISKYLIELPLNLEIINSAFQIDDIAELHDRLIAGSAKNIGCELLTNDPVIRNSKYVTSIWKE